MKRIPDTEHFYCPCEQPELNADIVVAESVITEFEDAFLLKICHGVFTRPFALTGKNRAVWTQLLKILQKKRKTLPKQSLFLVRLRTFHHRLLVFIVILRNDLTVINCAVMDSEHP